MQLVTQFKFSFNNFDFNRDLCGFVASSVASAVFVELRPLRQFRQLRYVRCVAYVAFVALGGYPALG